MPEVTIEDERRDWELIRRELLSQRDALVRTLADLGYSVQFAANSVDVFRSDTKSEVQLNFAIAVSSESAEEVDRLFTRIEKLTGEEILVRPPGAAGRGVFEERSAQTGAPTGKSLLCIKRHVDADKLMGMLRRYQKRCRRNQGSQYVTRREDCINGDIDHCRQE